MSFLVSQSKNKAQPCVAQVSYSEGDDFGAVWDRERRGIPVFAPRGISYLPCEGDRILLMPVEGTDTCVGVLCTTTGLAPGELMLSSSGGGFIHLKKDGTVSINGLTISPDGKIVSP